jgi:hypothetical protein
LTARICVNYAAEVDDEVKRVEALVARLQASMAATERECMGLHAALVEAIRRLNSAHLRTDDLMAALDKPGEAPLNWRGGPAPTSRQARREAYLVTEYLRIFKPEDQP